MDFKNGKELLELCESCGLSISQVMKQRECELGETSEEAVKARMKRALEIMKESAHSPLTEPKKSMGGLIGGEAKRIHEHRLAGKSMAGSVLSRSIAFSMAVLEVNSSMGLIVAAPTAGSSGIVPGLLLALQEEYGLPDSQILDALFNAGAIGYLAMRNATVAGAVGGCQAEGFCYGCFCCCRAYGRYTIPVSGRSFYRSHEYAWPCLRSHRRPGRVSLPGQKCCRRSQCPDCR